MTDALDPLDALRLAGDLFAARLDAVPADRWDAPSPCEGWTVRDVADHVTGGNRYAVALLGGATGDEAFAAAVAPGFGDDVTGDHHRSARAQYEAFAAPGALAATCDHVVGPVRGRTFAAMRTGDLVVHTWDLARGAGLDEDLDDRAVAAALAVYTRQADHLAASGMFGAGARGAVPADAPPLARLLDLVGRRP